MECRRAECQTTAGCAHRGPGGQMCYFKTPRLLSDYSDAEIAAEHYRRQLAKETMRDR